MTITQMQADKAAAAGVILHPETAIDITNSDRIPTPYRFTYPHRSEYLDSFHREIAEAPRKGILIDMGISGWLRREDALKLYELAYHARGDAIEFGTNRGLSTFIIAKALESSGGNNRLHTVEIRSDLADIARNTIDERGLASLVDFHVDDAARGASAFIQAAKRFDFCFVDHSHAYEPMAEICRLLPELIAAEGFVVFHDYNDRRNSRARNVGESSGEYGVFAAIEDTLDLAAFQFCGVYGCCGVFRRK